MMKRALRNTAICAAIASLGFSMLWAQKPKTPKEQQAILAIQVAKDPDERIKAIENVLTNFADTEFKVILLQMAVQTEEQKRDYPQTLFYLERLLKEDPKNAFALITIATETAQHTRENDLDKDEQLKKLDVWAKDGIEAAKTMPKVPATESDDDLAKDRKDMQAQGYLALGMADFLRKNYEGAANNYRQSLSVAATPNTATYVRLGQTYMAQGKLDDANYTLDKAINAPDASPQIKTVAQNLKNEIAKHKPAAPAGSAAPGSAAPATAPPATAPPASSAPPAGGH
jgi:tetratricopeptide (TPR) repeat protein